MQQLNYIQYVRGGAPYYRYMKKHQKCGDNNNYSDDDDAMYFPLSLSLSR